MPFPIARLNCCAGLLHLSLEENCCCLLPDILLGETATTLPPLIYARANNILRDDAVLAAPLCLFFCFSHTVTRFTVVGQSVDRPLVHIFYFRSYAVLLRLPLVVLYIVLYIVKKIHSSCGIDDFVETHLCKLCVMLRCAYYGLCVLVKDIGPRFPLQLQCSYQGQQGDVSQSVRGKYTTRF